MARRDHILWFDQLGMKDVPLVGGKTASLGELYNVLKPRGINVPNGFGITTDTYYQGISKADA